MTNSPRRPAHRPSRRGSVIDAAIGLFATYPAEAITVADIAAAANMTAAAVYYHFPSKERVLLEGLQSFARDYLAEVRRLSRETADGTWCRTIVVEVLEWLEVHRLAATVYFARSSGLDMTIEALRRETRIEQVNVFMRAIRASTPQPLAASDVGVMAVGLVAVLETAAACWLTQDAVFRGLGRHRFLSDAADLAERVVRSNGAVRDEQPTGPSLDDPAGARRTAGPTSPQ
jgi:AcrR family transcriptional regulator